MLMTSSTVDRHHLTISRHLQRWHGHTWRWSRHVPPKHWYTRQTTWHYISKDCNVSSAKISLHYSYVWPCTRELGRLRLKCDGTRAETRFRLSAKRTSPFKMAGASVQSTTGSRGVRISGGNAGYTTFGGSVNSTGYPLHSPVSPSLPLLCVVCHHISNGLYQSFWHCFL